jgi:hypothetical protein
MAFLPDGTLSLASDEDRYGTIFHAQTEVLPDPFPKTSSPEVAPRDGYILVDNVALHFIE